ncbi:MAG: universal stress protein [Gemmatimonadetes bacterium]|nr:universal stress protein [Gemmatimonadota bacterium]
MFTRLLVAIDGSPQADEAFEQTVILGRRFGATIVVATVREGRPSDSDIGAMLERAGERVRAAGLKAELVQREGDPGPVLAELAKGSDVALVGRRGRSSASADALGTTVTALLKMVERPVIVCGGYPSPMRTCALAFDGGDTSRRALELAARYAGITDSAVHIIHATDDRAAGLRVVGAAEATLSLQGVAFVTHIDPGKPGDVVAAAVKRTGCDALFAGAHVSRGRLSAISVSHAEEILRHTDIPVVIQQ